MRRHIPIGDCLAAERHVERLRGVFARWFSEYDVFLCPVVTIPAPPHGQSSYVVDGVTVPARNVMRATVPFNLTGLPAVALPFGAELLLRGNVFLCRAIGRPDMFPLCREVSTPRVGRCSSRCAVQP